MEGSEMTTIYWVSGSHHGLHYANQLGGCTNTRLGLHPLPKQRVSIQGLSVQGGVIMQA